MRKIFAFVLSLLILFQVAVATEAVGVSAVSAVVIDGESGRILYEKNAKDKRGMASTTKIMTAIVALEKGNPKDIVKVSSHASGVEGSSMYLKAGEKITIENLVYGLMLVSGNDSATAIAEHIAGNEKKFAVLMNEKAKEIGARDTHFTNPHGLADDEHYTTAQDLARITAYGLKNQTFAQIVSTKSKTIEREGMGATTLVNHNKLLKTYEGCVGVKTGFTKATGRCLVSSTKRNGMTLICVTLNAGDDWNDHKSLCDWVFKNYQACLYKRGGTLADTLVVKGGTNDEIGVLYGEDIRLLQKSDGEWEISLELPHKINAPVSKGQILGRAVATNQTGETRYFDLVAEKDVIGKYDSLGAGFGQNLIKTYGKWLKIFV